MDRRTLLAVFAFIGVYYVYLFVFRPLIYPEPPPTETARGR